MNRLHHFNLFFIIAILLPLLCHYTEGLLKRQRSILLAPPAPPGVPLKSKDVLEHGCPPVKGVQKLNTDFINKVPAWYVPMAHKHFFYNWAEALINRSIVASELPDMCMKWLFLAPTKPRGKYNVIVGGLKQAVTQLCMDTGFETETCEAAITSPNHQKKANNMGTIVATDNNRWFLLVRCVDKKYRDWAIFSNDKKALSVDLYRQLAMEIKNLKFDLSKVENSKYEKCS